MGLNVTEKLIKAHLVEGEMTPGDEIGLRIDQTLTQDATGTMVMLELEAMDLESAKTEASVQYVDHNLLQTDFRNADDHRFLLSACRRFGIWFSRPGNGVSHPVHMERTGKPGKTLLGSDSHTPAAGAMGMLAMGAGGLEVALAIAGEPFYLKMPKVMGVKLTGRLPDWVSAKDVILEMLRRHDVSGGVGKVIEYYGDGLAGLSAMDRHVIANMGAELGATSTVFPADQNVLEFLTTQGRAGDYTELVADADADYDEHDEIDLATLEPLIALPSSPGNVKKVSEVVGRPIGQSYIGSSANAGYRDFAICALIVDGRQVADSVSLDINPTSRQILENLTAEGHLNRLIHAGARIHQAGCNGCIGMGQAPGTGQISLRTTPRNFPGRSGTKGDAVYLCSPETAVASALTGVITDPRTLPFDYPKFEAPAKMLVADRMLVPPPETGAPRPELEKGPNIKTLPIFDSLPSAIEAEVIIKVGDNVSTDEIMPAGNKVLPYRSNVEAISRFVYSAVDESFADRAEALKPAGSIIVGGSNYGQGSSREHAALAPRYLGVRAVIVKSFARIHHQNLANFGILPLLFNSEGDYDKIEQGQSLRIALLNAKTLAANELVVTGKSGELKISVRHMLSARQQRAIIAGSVMNIYRNKG